ncbi:MAG: cytochrome c [Phycisphaerales bacterium]|nr:cytochrome c [Phycisphaerales bacterium]
MTTPRTTRPLPSAALAAGLCAGILLLPGCRDTRSDKPPHQFFPDMDDQPKWIPQTRSQFYADERTMRQPVKGTVAFGRVQFINDAGWAAPFMRERDILLKDDDRIFLGVAADGSWLRDIPVPVTEALVKRGQDRFNIYCSVCHGYTGDGKGMVGDSTKPTGWSYPLPNFHDAKYTDKANSADRKAYDGYIFNVARNGVILEGQQKMPGYAHALNEYDAWAVVSYIRALQAAQSGTLADITAEADRVELERRRPPVAPPAPEAAPTPAPAPAPAPASAPAAPSGGQP